MVGPHRFRQGVLSDISVTYRLLTRRAAIADRLTLEKPEQFNANIENFFGPVRLPVGIIGPLRINGLNAHGNFHVPMATTEAALVASCARGAIGNARLRIFSRLTDNSPTDVAVFHWQDNLGTIELVSGVGRMAVMDENSKIRASKVLRSCTLHPAP